MVITAKKKEEDKGKILSLLKEKYGEEFEVLTIKRETSSGFSGGLISGRPWYEAVCSPIQNKDVIFEATVWEDGKKVEDKYSQAGIEKSKRYCRRNCIRIH